MTNEKFLVKTEVFEGPLDLLLNLIEKRKLLINEISLAKITDDYITYIQENSNIELKKNAHFILVASTLVLIKSKSLLPTIDLTREEEDDIKDLETRLKIYKRIKETEDNLLGRFDKNNCYFKSQNKIDEVVFAPSNQINTENIKQNIAKILNSLPKKETLPKRVVKKVISLEETIVNLTYKIKQSVNMNFKDFAKVDKEERVNVVVSFLAMLELVKQGMIEANQKDDFGDIELQTRSFETPNYS
jgi:segregation and condensation protein A